jgi:hypothetical protein
MGGTSVRCWPLIAVCDRPGATQTRHLEFEKPKFGGSNRVQAEPANEGLVGCCSTFECYADQTDCAGDNGHQDGDERLPRLHPAELTIMQLDR